MSDKNEIKYLLALGGKLAKFEEHLIQLSYELTMEKNQSVKEKELIQAEILQRQLDILSGLRNLYFCEIEDFYKLDGEDEP